MLRIQPTPASPWAPRSRHNVSGMERMRQIRGLPGSHNLTLVVSSFAQLGQYVQMDNHEFRAIKRATPGHYTFVLHATKELPRMQQPTDGPSVRRCCCHTPRRWPCLMHLASRWCRVP